MVDVNDMILFKIKEKCKKEKFNEEILSRGSPHKEIREGYIKIVSNLLAGIPTFMFEENNNNKKHSKEKEKMTREIIERWIEKNFGEYLKDVKKRYPEDIWKVKECLIKGDKNEKEKSKMA